MLANGLDNLAQFGTLGTNVQRPEAFRHELLDFISSQLPCWRDRPERPNVTAETLLTSQLCAHLNSAARHSDGWDILQFRVEEADEQNSGRKIDLVASPSDTTIIIEGRRHTDFDSLMPIECKRLPTPQGKDRDEREYVTSRYSTTGGIQRFKAGNHGAIHKLGAMIGYVQEETTAFWDQRVSQWINDLISTGQAGWTREDLLRFERRDATLRLAILHSSHKRQKGLAEIELCHLWVEMN
jgi:hypothetical protein